MTLLLSDAIMKKIKCDYVNITQKKKKNPTNFTFIFDIISIQCGIVIIKNHYIIIQYDIAIICKIVTIQCDAIIKCVYIKNSNKKEESEIRLPTNVEYFLQKKKNVEYIIICDIIIF